MIKTFFVLFGFIGLLFFSTLSFARVNVFACEPEWASLAKELGGDNLHIMTATTAFQNPHYIEARPSLIAGARNADIIFCSGAELEIGWLPLLLRQSGNPRIQLSQPGYFMAAEQVERIDVPVVLDRSLGDIHASGNPHVHLDPYRLLQVAEAFSTRLQQIDANNGKRYEEKFHKFAARWQEAIVLWERQASLLKGKKAIVQHGHYNYFFKWLGIEKIADLEPLPGLPPTSSHLAYLLSTTNDARPDFILIAAYQNSRGAEWLSRRADIPVIVLPYTVGGNKEAGDLFALYKNSLDLLLAGLE